MQRQQTPQDRLVVGLRWMGALWAGPAVGGPDGAVEGLVGLGEPRGRVFSLVWLNSFVSVVGGVGVARIWQAAGGRDLVRY